LTRKEHTKFALEHKCLLTDWVSACCWRHRHALCVHNESCCVGDFWNQRCAVFYMSI